MHLKYLHKEGITKPPFWRIPRLEKFHPRLISFNSVQNINSICCADFVILFVSYVFFLLATLSLWTLNLQI